MSEKKRLWQPTIDETRCTACRICHDFCPKGVYGFTPGGKVVVKNGEQCVDGCHGCEWQCPSWAITFPEPITADYIAKAVDYYGKKGKPVPSTFTTYVKGRYGLEFP
ncbi:MAG: 4Fe-4S ferredoxin iron-sulfur binding domain protein [Holophagaceae bacterium]|nr:4Fe-4S ferredoxin iron-sulfur binding domain protein [Holophagaceae bacterium]